jgi:hypothetical protein
MSNEAIRYTGETPLLTVLRDTRYIGQEAMRNSAADEIERLRAALREIAEEFPDSAGFTDGRRIAMEALDINR